MSDIGAPRPKRAARIAIGIAALGLVGVLIVALVNRPPGGDQASRAADSASAVVPAVVPVADVRPAATPEQAYALSLPVLGHWLENDFDNAWIVAAGTVEAAAATLDHAALDDVDYARWVSTFERVIAVAEAVTGGDQAAALAAFEPLLAEHPGPYVDVAVDRSLSPTPYEHAEARLAELDAAISAEDRAAARRASGHTAAALAEVVLAAQIHLPQDAGRVLTELVPAFRALNGVQEAVLHGGASDAAASAGALHEAVNAFHDWYEAETA